MRKAGAVMVIATLHVTWALAQGSSGSAAANPTITVAGCLVREGNRVLLNGAPTATDRRHHSAGSNAARASTPIRYVESGLVERSGSAGSNSPKGSTPLPAGTSETERKTAGAMSAKGSVPIAKRALQTYELIGSTEQLSNELGHAVEIDGIISPDSATSGVRQLSIQQLRVVSAGCSQ